MEEQNIILFVLADREIPGIVKIKKETGLTIEPLISRNSRSRAGRIG
jgi:hypothetical protein